ncbi:hypothetical protein HPP92_006944 [Vanilla planifolia]|uniref:Uncharacterized protein n=1 Tax=Vanilla planifolia TaxID=51239 RepID=A0A835RDD0_VANPL|nr:hypothetical protein HPP92_007179 [Vanilla planifolia]KAG0490081.1 hypothetical protein HPP92_006944 [Vanilla planifolia]
MKGKRERKARGNHELFSLVLSWMDRFFGRIKIPRGGPRQGEQLPSIPTLKEDRAFDLRVLLHPKHVPEPVQAPAVSAHQQDLGEAEDRGHSIRPELCRENSVMVKDLDEDVLQGQVEPPEQELSEDAY